MASAINLLSPRDYSLQCLVHCQGRRPVYYKRNIKIVVGRHPGKFSYCESEKAWKQRLFHWMTCLQPDGLSGWTDDALAPADPHFELSCGEWCERDVDCSYGHGRCQKKTCERFDSWTGRNCQTYVDYCSLLRSELSFSNGGVTKTSPNASKAFLHLECIAYKERPVFYRYEEGFGINTTLGVQDNDLEKLQSGVLNSNLGLNNGLTFVSELTTTIEPHSGNVKWRNNWPPIGPTLHLSCLLSYLKYVCQSFEARFDKTLWNQCTEDSCTFCNEIDLTSAAVLPNGRFSDIYEVSRDSLGNFDEWKGRRLVYYQLRKLGYLPLIT
eukprot:scaffold22307_cov29-Attheya_sp.AAC.5